MKQPNEDRIRSAERDLEFIDKRLARAREKVTELEGLRASAVLALDTELGRSEPAEPTP